MINRIIWKVILMFGGIAGSIYSISKLPNAYEEWSTWHEIYNKNEAGWFYASEKTGEAAGVLFTLVFLLIISIIAFIIGGYIKAPLQQENQD